MTKITNNHITIIMKHDDRMIEDLTDEERKDYEENPDKYEQVIDNTNDFYRSWMYPNGEPDADEDW